MKRFNVTLVMMLCVIGLLMITSNGFSYTEKDDDLYSKYSPVSKMLTKLGRGVTNVFTGWLEIPKKMSRTWREKGDPVSGFFVGGATGFGLAIARTGVGFYDVFTFPIPFPKDYASVIQPEMIISNLWGQESLPFMDDLE